MRPLMMDRVLACIHLTDEAEWIKRERSNGYAATNATRLPSRRSWILLQPLAPIKSAPRFLTPKSPLSTKQSNRFESIGIPGKLVAGRLDPTPTSNTLLLLPSGIRVSGIQSWVRKLTDVA